MVQPLLIFEVLKCDSKNLWPFKNLRFKIPQATGCIFFTLSIVAASCHSNFSLFQRFSLFQGFALLQGLVPFCKALNLFFASLLCHFNPGSLGLSLGPCTCHRPKLKIQVVILKKTNQQTKTAVTTNKQASGIHSGTAGMGSIFMLPGPSIALACRENKTNKWQHKCDTAFALHDAKRKNKQAMH